MLVESNPRHSPKACRGRRSRGSFILSARTQRPLRRRPCVSWQLCSFMAAALYPFCGSPHGSVSFPTTHLHSIFTWALMLAQAQKLVMLCRHCTAQTAAVIRAIEYADSCLSNCVGALPISVLIYLCERIANFCPRPRRAYRAELQCQTDTAILLHNAKQQLENFHCSG
jgi:hypothetical protein